MAVNYKTQEEKVEQRLTGVLSKKAGGFVLCSFSHAEDLLFGIDALKSFNIPIYEVHSPTYIDALKTRLELKKLNTGQIALKYGCFGGASITSIIFYAAGHNWGAPATVRDYLGMGLQVFFLVFAIVFASWLTMNKPPEIVKLPSNDTRFLIVIKTRNIIADEGVASFLQYSGSVEITQAVKKMLLS
ncbi:MAG: quinol:electron acceptor oxidoreductase subunit ActD [Mucilaginibacter sp.]|uniref:quinol:electron acceptor oxidoreductase subunit ActD n=1 Tax=Mucilaginibacter sp. TaxID=1882438 RepID=UPI0031AB8803